MTDSSSSKSPLNNYQRPNQVWECGNHCQQCPAGPNKSGECGGTMACQPVQLGGEWKCTRSIVDGGACVEGPSHDGHCCKSAVACVPQRSSKNRKRLLATLVSATILGSLLIGFFGPWGREFLAPGPLCQKHAQVLNGLQAAQRCSACHDELASVAPMWLANIGSNSAGLGPVQSEKCLACHGQQLNSNQVFTAHGLGPEELHEISSRQEVSAYANRMITKVLAPTNSELACSTCHKEHRGSKQDLTRMTDSQCQACHQNFHQHFAVDHPEFSNWPLAPQKQILFDHRTHSAKHFPEKGTSFECRQCHVDDSFQNVKTTVSFEKACQSCHNQPILASISSGQSWFRLPMVEKSALESANISLGEWPSAASEIFDGQIPPIMRLLLQGDPRAAEALKSFPASKEFADVATDNPQELKAVGDLCWAIKRLLFDLAREDRDAITKRLQVALGPTVTNQELTKLVDQVPFGTIRGAQEKWFPNLAAEIGMTQNSGRQLESQELPSQENSGKVGQVQGSSDPFLAAVELELARRAGELADEEKSQVNLAPAGPFVLASTANIAANINVVPSADKEVLLENPLKNYKRKSSSGESPSTNATVTQTPSTQPPQPQSQPPAASTTAAPTQAPPAEGTEPKPALQSVPPAQAAPLTNNPLRTNPVNPLRSTSPEKSVGNSPTNELRQTPLEGPTTPTPSTTNPTSPAVTAPDSSLNTQPNSAANVPPASPMPGENQPVENKPAEAASAAITAPKEPETTAPESGSEVVEPSGTPIEESLPKGDPIPYADESHHYGWLRDDETFSIKYYATGHADIVLSSLLSAAKRSLESEVSQEHADDQTRLALQSLLASNSSGLCSSCHTLSVPSNRWKSELRDPGIRRFTNFSHQPHMLQPSLLDCTACHQMSALASSLAAPNSKSPGIAESISTRSIDAMPQDAHHSDFVPMQKGQCSTCHRPNAASSSCTTCHSYHIGAQILGHKK